MSFWIPPPMRDAVEYFMFRPLDVSMGKRRKVLAKHSQNKKLYKKMRNELENIEFAF